MDLKGFIRNDAKGLLRRWLLWALVLVVGVGMVVVQGRGGGEYVGDPAPIDLADAIERDDQDALRDEPDEFERLELPDAADQADGADDSTSGGQAINHAALGSDGNRTHDVVATSPLQDLLAWPGVGKWALVNEAFATLAIPDVGYAAWELAAGEQRQAIHVLAWERDNESVQLRSALAQGRVLGIEPVVAVADRLTRSSNSGSAIAAVNADFFMGSPVLGQPIGIHVSDGELIVDPNGRPLFALFNDGRIWIGEVEFQASVERMVGGTSVAEFPLAGINRAAIPNGLTLYTSSFEGAAVTLRHADSTAVILQALLGPLKAGATHQAVVIRHITGPGEVEIPAQGAVLVGRGTAAEFVRALRPADRIQLHLNFEPALTGVQQAVAGSHMLVWNGETASLDRDDPLVYARHPRTAIGYNDEVVFLVTVDGRQPGYANGMTLPELAELFVALGADAALNLDGGGSTTMAIRRSEDQSLSVVNRPSDGSPRAVGNALVLMRVEPLGDS